MIAERLFDLEPRLRLSRAWAMPSPQTFSIGPIADLLDRWLVGRDVIVDPFSGDSTRATHRNDLKAGGAEALDWLSVLDITADAVLFDPPYSPRQIAEVYKGVGLAVNMETTQASFWTQRKDACDRLLKRGGVAICCGWNTTGFGIQRGYILDEILLVCARQWRMMAYGVLLDRRKQGRDRG